MFGRFVRVEDIAVAIVSEPYNVGGTGWCLDSTGGAAIGVLHRGLTLGSVDVGDGYVAAVVGGRARVYSCYAPPSLTPPEFERFLNCLEGSIRGNRNPGLDLVIAGDFNARSTAWGDCITTNRGRALAEFADSLGLVLMNVGRDKTFFGRGRGSCVDVTFASEHTGRRIRGWTVRTDEENTSDHYCLCYSLLSHRLPRGPPTDSSTNQGLRRGFSGWKTEGMDGDLLTAALVATVWAKKCDEIAGDATTHGSEAKAENLARLVTHACNIALPQRSICPRGRPPVYWWNSEIAAARSECVLRRRRMTRERGRARGGNDDTVDQATEEYRLARKSLKSCIRDSKARCWKELIQTVDSDPWGKPYRVVLRKIRGPPATATMEPQMIREIATALFPGGDPNEVGELEEDSAEDEAGELLPFTQGEVDAAVSRFRSRNKAPGPDGIPSRVWGAVHAARPDLLTGVLNSCLEEGNFPGRWKRARLALVAKPGKPVGAPSSYRPLCLLDDAGKILEYLVAMRMAAHMEVTGIGLSERQYGFRAGRSTDDALRSLHELLVGACNAGRIAVAVGLDIKNAFNSIGWGVIQDAVVRMGFPLYIKKMIRSYLSSRVLHLGTNDRGGLITMGVTCGVPQGSVIGPLLWNIAYDSVFRLPLPRGATTIGYADDTMVVAEGSTPEELEDVANGALAVVSEHIAQLGLRLAVEKTEAVLFRQKYKVVPPRIHIQGSTVPLGPSLKYLGVVLENRGTMYGAHWQKTADKAGRVLGALAGLMPNIGGPCEARRRLLTSVVQSVLLYGAPTWAPSLRYNRRATDALAAIQRRAAIRTVGAYRTVSLDAVATVAGLVPIDLLALERHRAYDARRTAEPTGEGQTFPNLRADTMAKWVDRLRDEAPPPRDSGREWTRLLLPPELLGRWVSRTHGEMHFHLTQLLTGHGCFNRYLHRISRAPSQGCSHCGPPDDYGEEEDSAHHTLMRCEAFCADRDRLTGEIGSFRPEELIPRMLERPENWTAVARFASDVMLAKEDAERARQTRQGVLPSRRARRRRLRGRRPVTG